MGNIRIDKPNDQTIILINIPPLLSSSLRIAIGNAFDVWDIGDLHKLTQATFPHSTQAIVVLGTMSSPPELSASLRTIREGFRRAYIIVISSEASNTHLSAAVAEDVRGYVTWATNVADLEAVIRIVAQGGIAYCTPIQTLFQEYAQRVSMAKQCIPNLTTREAAIVAQVAGGRSNFEISLELGISVKTVEGHITRLLRRTGARSRVDLATAWTYQYLVGKRVAHTND